ncbi:MAG: hypothetical protein KDN05_21325, partial [Verrucomicrobiae bacterium]|nr:hypothetical protein [Verrucomicrobiae bacterium]
LAAILNANGNSIPAGNYAPRDYESVDANTIQIENYQGVEYLNFFDQKGTVLAQKVEEIAPPDEQRTPPKPSPEQHNPLNPPPGLHDTLLKPPPDDKAILDQYFKRFEKTP